MPWPQGAVARRQETSAASWARWNWATPWLRCLLLAWLRRATFGPFALYRVVLGLALLVWIYAFDTVGLI